MENKYQLDEYVVYQGVVCQVRCIYTDLKQYNLTRVFPNDPFWKVRISEELIEKWDGTILPTIFHANLKP